MRRDEQPRRVDIPTPGFFKTRLVRKGPFVAARIWISFGFWAAEINGAPCGQRHQDPAYADGVFRIWTTGVSITQAEYAALLHKPPPSPDTPINIGAMPPTF